MAITLDRATLEAALVGYQRQAQDIDLKMTELRRRLAGFSGKTAAPRRPRKTLRRKQTHRMSAEGRARIAEAQRARWAKTKKAQG